MVTRTEFLKLALVALTTNDLLLDGLSFGRLGLDGGHPAVTLVGIGGLEGVLLAVELEHEIVGAVLGDIGDITLQLRVSPTPLSSLPMTLCRT